MHELAVRGPTNLEDLRAQVGFDAPTMRRARATLERVGAVVSREVEVAARNGGHRHTSELSRWDQISTGDESADAALIDPLLEAGVTAAVAAPEREATTWFAWPAGDAIQRLVAAGRLTRPCGVWLTTTH